MSLLVRASFRHHLKRPFQTFLCVLGIATGVAVVLAIDLANASARQAFDLSAETITGTATHSIVGGPKGLDEALYRTLKLTPGMPPSAPLIESEIALTKPDAGSFRLIGIDPFADGEFRSFTGAESGVDISVSDFLTKPGGILMSAELAGEFDLEGGSRAQIRSGGTYSDVEILSLMSPSDPLQARGLAHVMVADLSTAQELLGRAGVLTRIDLILEDVESTAGKAQLESLQAILPKGAEIVASTVRAQGLGRMIEAFELNLGFLSLLALVVGAFLIYNTMTFSVVQRRGLWGRMRAFGVSRPEIMRAVLSEALLFGVLGTALGIGLGIALAQGLVHVVTQTINDLYFVVSVRDTVIPVWALMKAGALGIVVTLGVAWWPAREATRQSPRLLSLRSALESRVAKNAPRLAFGGFVVGLLGVALMAYPSRSLLLCYVALFFIVVGFALMAPWLTALLMRALTPIMGTIFGARGRMITGGVIAALSRTGVAVGALAIALSMVLGVGIMIESFRSTVITWLDDTLQADIYVTLPGTVARVTSQEQLDATLLEKLVAAPGIKGYSTNRSVRVRSELGEIRLVALGAGEEFTPGYKTLDGDQSAVTDVLLKNKGILITEPFSFRHDLGRGDSLRLETESGEKTFGIAGVIRDYASDQGYVVMARDRYVECWQDEGVSALALFLEPDVDPNTCSGELLRLAGGEHELIVRTQGAIRDVTLEVFDRTFRITGVLRLLATIVAFIGVLSALMAVQLERSRELGVMRAQGFSLRELRGQTLGQTALMGLAAGLLALPLGVVFAWVLTAVVNRRSFGWSLPLEVNAGQLAETLALAIIAAIVAGLIPAMRLGRISPAEALRTE